MILCVPLQAKTNSEALSLLRQVRPLADVVEIRIDGMKRPDLPRLLAEHPESLLVTNRRHQEGGGFKGDEQERIWLIEEAVTLGAGYVDVEAATDLPLISEVKGCIERHKTSGTTGRDKNKQTRLILSWHDFEGTPSNQSLRRRFRSMAAVGADLVKIVTYARQPEDNLRILELIPYARNRGQEIIAFCMGPLGRPSRVLSCLFGAAMTFAARKRWAESAPGQLTVDETRRIWEILVS